MIKQNFIGRATELGFRAGTESSPNEILAEIVESRIPAYWETFPALLANAADGGEFTPAATAALLPESDRKALKELFLVSLGLYQALGEEFKWRHRLFPDCPARLVSGLAARLERCEDVQAGAITIPAARLTAAYSRCRRQGDALSAAVLEIFTPRQAALLFKKLRREKLTKTEGEYFSRVIRKKAAALADERLHRLARKVLE